MARKISMKLIPALMLVAFSGAASASGFQLLEQNASGIGNAYAGSAAVAENASTIFYNPAGMTQLQDREAAGGISAVNPSFSFKNNGSSTGAFTNAGDGGDAGGWAGIPNGYLSLALNKNLYVGIGFGAPFGLKTEYDSSWVGAAQATMFDIKTYNINPSVAYRVNDKVSLGVGLNWQKIEAEYTRQANVLTAPANFYRVQSKMNLEDSAWGWNAGALFTISPSTKVGLSYRSKVKYHTNGAVALSSDGTPQGNIALANVTLGSASNIAADLTVPDTFIMSVAQKLSDKWEMLGDVSWTGWSSIPKVDIMRTSGPLSLNPATAKAQTLDTDFRNTWRIALGANYMLNDTWKLKYGVAYDQSPVKGADKRLTSLPDNDRVWFSLGAQWAPSKASRLDLGASYIYLRDSKIDNNQSVDLRGRVVGDYEGNVWVFGAQYSMSF